MSQTYRIDYSQASEDVLFIAANEQRTLFYYCAEKPKIKTNAANQPEIALNIYRNSQQQETVFYAMLSLQCQLECTLQQAQAAAALLDIPADAILLPLQATDCHATLDISGFLEPKIFQAVQNSAQYCYMAVKFPQASDIEIFSALLADPATTPLAVSYKIDYLQQLPPSIFELQAEWQQVYEYLEQHVGFNLLFFKTDIENISSRLITEQKVVIKTRIVDPDTVIEQAGKELTQILLAEFFSPVFSEPTAQSPDRIGFYLQKTVQHDYSHRQLSARLEEYSAVKRSIYPQALLAEMVAGSDYQPNKVIRKQEIHDDFFTQRKVTFHLLDSELDSNILLLLVNITYGEIHQNVYFTAEDSLSKTFSAPAIIDEETGRTYWPVQYSFTLYFQSAIAGISQIHSDVYTTTLEEAWIDAASLYSRYNFTLLAEPDFNWQWYEKITLELTCVASNEEQKSTGNSLILTSQQPEAGWSVLLPGIDNFQFNLAARYQRAAGLPHLPATVSYPIGQQAILSSRLYPQRCLLVSASADWQKISQILAVVQFPYAGDSSPVLKQTMQFTRLQPDAQLFSADQPDPQHVKITLMVIISYLDAEQPTETYPLCTVADTIDITQRD
ncbi:hypothetical protein [Candidatus Pantoea multigeneris]|uniref:Uncharacterized protein n=1 Tax=Candidatus Pantoea multigeneris TaxID=2608357 RepID=A0ABX0RBZ9_9GAMM|nr:hypothetical protein [Pantoea multigeneris]NIF22880.1 hypothetical protein [Pantoea multigeneris]